MHSPPAGGRMALVLIGSRRRSGGLPAKRRHDRIPRALSRSASATFPTKTGPASACAARAVGALERGASRAPSRHRDPAARARSSARGDLLAAHGGLAGLAGVSGAELRRERGIKDGARRRDRGGARDRAPARHGDAGRPRPLERAAPRQGVPAALAGRRHAGAHGRAVSRTRATGSCATTPRSTAARSTARSSSRARSCDALCSRTPPARDPVPQPSLGRSDSLARGPRVHAPTRLGGRGRRGCVCSTTSSWAREGASRSARRGCCEGRAIALISFALPMKTFYAHDPDLLRQRPAPHRAHLLDGRHATSSTRFHRLIGRDDAAS